MIKNNKGKKIKKVFIVPYSHIDWAWRNNRQYFIHRNRQVIFAALDFLNDEKNYCWEGIHKFHTISDFWENYPEFRKRLKAFVRQGRIDLTGSTLMTPLPPWYEEEVMIRNVVYGKRAYNELFGAVEDFTLYFADVPMCFSQLPQFASKLGFKYYLIDRPEFALISKGIPGEFIFQSPDSSSVLCNRTFYGGIRFPGGGNHTVLSPGTFEDRIQAVEEKVSSIAQTSSVPIIYLPDASDWAFPTLNLVEFISFWNEEIEEPKLTIATHTGYFKELEKHKNNLPIFKGNLDPVSWNGVYGTNGEKSNLALREATNALVMSEELSSISDLLAGNPFNENEIVTSWSNLCLLYAHGGYSTSQLMPEDHVFSINLLEKEKNRTSEILSSCLNSLTQEGKRIFIFNPLIWERKAWIEYENKSFWIKVPSLGYSFAAAQTKNTEISVSDKNMENEYYRLDFEDGKLAGIYSKEEKRELIEKSKYAACEIVIDEGEITLLTANFFQTHNLIYDSKIDILRNDIHTATVGLNAKFGKNTVHQEVSLYSGKRGIHVRTEIVNTDANLRYRICLPLSFSGETRLFGDDLFIIEEKKIYEEPIVGLSRSNPPKDAFESPLETMKRKTKGENKGVFYALKFASLEDTNIGIALFNKGTTGYKIDDNVLSNILLRSAGKENLDQYGICSHLSGKGRFVFEHEIYPYKSGSRVDVMRKALEFNFPLLVLPGREAKFSEELSLLSINVDNIILTAFYREGNYFHLHLYEFEGKDTLAEFEFLKSIKEIKETDLLGNNAVSLKSNKNKCMVEFKPFQICNLIVSFK